VRLGGGIIVQRVISPNLSSVSLTDVKQLFDVCYSLTARIQNIDRENWFDLLTFIYLLPYLFDAFLWDVECPSDSAAARLQKLDAGRFVPDDVICAERAHEDQHEPRIAHGV